jgi:hypothetical protein
VLGSLHQLRITMAELQLYKHLPSILVPGRNLHPLPLLMNDLGSSVLDPAVKPPGLGLQGDLHMRKANLKKLTISRETLRNLSADQLAEIAGGVTRFSGCEDCSLTNCDTCRTTTTSAPTVTCV